MDYHIFLYHLISYFIIFFLFTYLKLTIMFLPAYYCERGRLENLKQKRMCKTSTIVAGPCFQCSRIW